MGCVPTEQSILFSKIKAPLGINPCILNTEGYKKIGLMIVFLVFFIFFLHPIDSDGDFYHHVNIGKRIWQERALPHTDTQTFTAQGHEFVGYAWASGLLFYLLYSHFGAVAINILVALVAVLTLLLLYLLLRSYEVSFRTAMLTFFLVAPAMATRWPTRPEIFTYPCLFALLLCDHLSEKNRRYVFAIPIVVLLWVNFYGASFPVGIFLLLLIMIKKLSFRARQQTGRGISLNPNAVEQDPSTPQKNLRANFLVLVGMTLGFSLLSGYGLKSIFFITNIPRMTRLHGDWTNLATTFQTAPLEYLADFQYRLLVFFLYFVLFLVVVVLSGKRVLRYSFFVLLSGFLIFPFIAIRQMSLGVLLSAPLLAVLLNSLSGKKRQLVFAVAILVGLSSLSLLFWQNPPNVGEDQGTFPPPLIQFLQEKKLTGRTFNTQRIGGFLSYHLFPDNLIYSDTRDELYLGTSALTDLEDVLPMAKSILPLLGKYQADVIIADLSEGLSYQPLFYANEWAVVYLDNRYAVAISSLEAKEKHLPVLSAIDVFSPTGAKPLLEKQAVSEYQILTQQHPEASELQLRLAEILFRQKRYDEAWRQITMINSKFMNQSPLYLVEVESLAAEIYLAKDDCQQTKISLAKAQSKARVRLLFQSDKVIPSKISKISAQYALACLQDLQLAKKYLRQYLSQQLSPVDRLQTEREFQELVKKF